jgi:ferredoxin like protein
MSSELLNHTLEDKLFRTKYEPDADNSHIQVDSNLCQTCVQKPCTYICPAKVYNNDPNNEKLISISHENCLECGTCIKICPSSAISWKCPDGAIGVKYRFG